MSQNFESLMSRFSNAKPRTSGGNYFSGNAIYEVELLATSRVMGFSDKAKTRKDRELFVADVKVVSVESADPEIAKKYFPGSTASWVLPLDNEANEGDAKAFVLAAAGENPGQLKGGSKDINDQAAILVLAAMGEAEAFSRSGLPTDFFVGKRLRLETRTITTKAGTPFTKHIWSPIR